MIQSRRFSSFLKFCFVLCAARPARFVSVLAPPIDLFPISREMFVIIMGYIHDQSKETDFLLYFVLFLLAVEDDDPKVDNFLSFTIPVLFIIIIIYL